MNEKEDEVMPSRCGDPTITYSGKLDVQAWATKVKQVLGDLEAGRYEKNDDKTKEKPLTAVYKRGNSTLKVYGKPNITRFTKALMQIEEDIAAGRYKNKDQNKENPTED